MKDTENHFPAPGDMRGKRVERGLNVSIIGDGDLLVLDQAKYTSGKMARVVRPGCRFNRFKGTVMLKRIASFPGWGLTCRYAIRTGLMLALVMTVASLSGCRKPDPPPTLEEILAGNVVLLQNDLDYFVKLTDEVNAIAATRPVVKQALEPLRAQVMIARICLNEMNRRLDTIGDEVAAQTGTRSNGSSSLSTYLEENLRLVLDFQGNTMLLESFLKLVKAEPAPADHEVESWVKRFKIQRKNLASFAPKTEP